jgi:hypothetical protein
MKRGILVILLLLCGASWASAVDPFPVASIYNTPGYPGGEPYDPTIKASVVVWSNGRIVWSQDQRPGFGCPPFLIGPIDPAQATALVGRFEKRGAFNKSLRHYLGDHAAANMIHLQISPRRKTRFGLTREHLRDYHTAEEKEYRVLWDDMRHGIEALIPGQGRPFAGSPFRPPK